ncbi:MAG: GNAT family N-acetyltransferase [Acidimicrobiia bacterium]|nr:GNAT family N-acetyltransferase [Acidimicrobiia bacterium]
MKVEIRRIRADEGPLLMQVRLLSLLDAPYAFASTYTDSVQRPKEHWKARAAEASAGGSSAVIVAFAPDGPIGMAGAYTPDDRPEVRMIFGVWVEPALRGQGVGRRLTETVIDWAFAAGADRCELWVAEPNSAARVLYETLGFEDTGERQPFPSDETVTELKLVRRADREPSA